MLTYLLMWWRKSARPPGLIVAAEAEAEGAKGKNYCDSETLQSYVLNRQPPLASPLIGRLRHSEPLIGCCQASVQVLKASNTGTFHFCSRLPDSVSLMSGSDHPRPVIKTQHYKETSWHWDIPQVIQTQHYKKTSWHTPGDSSSASSWRASWMTSWPRGPALWWRPACWRTGSHCASCTCHAPTSSYLLLRAS